MRSRHGAAAGICIIALLLIFSVIFCGEDAVDTARRLLPPSLSEPFGTDTLGRSLIVRTAGGTLISMGIGFAASFLSVVAGTAAAFCFSLPRFPKSVLLSLSDALKSVPPILLALFLASLSGPGIPKLIIAISVPHIADIARTSYAKVKALRNEGFIEAERSLGAGRARIFMRHMLPHLMPYLSLQGVTVFLSAVISESTLSFLGCGVSVPSPSLGAILAEARPVILSAPWAALFPAAVLLLLSLSLEVIALSLSESDASSHGTGEGELVGVAELSADGKS